MFLQNTRYKDGWKGRVVRALRAASRLNAEALRWRRKGRGERGSGL
jgi:hypothetical protein